MRDNDRGKSRVCPRLFASAIVALAAVLFVHGSLYASGKLEVTKVSSGATAVSFAPSGININHKFHEDTVGIGCDTCHQPSETNTRFMTFPNHDTCSACHADAVDPNSPQKNCELCHNLPGYKTNLRKNVVLSPLVSFDHKLHLDNKVSCETCHTVTDYDVRKGDEMLPKMDACVACHSKINPQAASDCQTCHVKGFQKIVPASHTKGWEKIHGQGLTKDTIDSTCLVCHTKQLNNSCTTCHHNKQVVARRADYCARCHGSGFDTTRPADHGPLWVTNHGKGLTQAQIDSRCTLCHTAQNGNDCLTCHKRSDPPKSHTLAWTLQGHGVRAETDRQSCTVCHDQSECITCHTTNEPFSHTGLWGSPSDRHCLYCHLDGASYVTGAVGGNCGFCHQSAQVFAKHMSLPMIGHNTGTDCTTCHSLSAGIGTSIQHPYPPVAAQCVSCHQ